MDSRTTNSHSAEPNVTSRFALSFTPQNRSAALSQKNARMNETRVWMDLSSLLFLSFCFSVKRKRKFCGGDGSVRFISRIVS